MNDEQLGTLEDLQGFLDGTVTMEFTVADDERYAFIARTVKRFGYRLAYRVYGDVVFVTVIRVGKRDRQQVHEAAQSRLRRSWS